MNDLFVKQVTLVKDESMTDQYPFCIDLIQHFDSLSFEKPVSFFQIKTVDNLVISL